MRPACLLARSLAKVCKLAGNKYKDCQPGPTSGACAGLLLRSQAWPAHTWKLRPRATAASPNSCTFASAKVTPSNRSASKPRTWASGSSRGAWRKVRAPGPKERQFLLVIVAAAAAASVRPVAAPAFAMRLQCGRKCARARRPRIGCYLTQTLQITSPQLVGARRCSGSSGARANPLALRARLDEEEEECFWTKMPLSRK